MKVLIGGVGYTFLRDHSVGPEVVRRLATLPWPPNVLVEDLSYGPIAVVHFLRETLGPEDKFIVTGAVKRGRRPGEVRRYRWEGTLPGDREVQARVVEAISGVISLENLLIVATRFGALPREVVVIEVEPQDESWGPDFTPPVKQAVEQVVLRVRQEVDGWVNTPAPSG